MALIDSSDVTISWNSAPLTEVDECNGIQIERSTSDSVPFGADVRKKRVSGFFISEDVTLKVPLDDTAGTDFMLLWADYKANTERTFEVSLGASVSRSLSMTIIKANPILVGGEITFYEFTLANTGGTLTEA